MEKERKHDLLDDCVSRVHMVRDSTPSIVCKLDSCGSASVSAVAVS